VNERINDLSMTTQDVVLTLVEGNPGALRVCLEILADNTTDLDNSLGGFGVLLSLDTLHIYGSRIWMLYKDVCKQNISNVLAVLRGWQLGHLTRDVLNHAIDNMGDGIDLNAVMTEVQKELPNFNTRGNEG